VPEDIVTQVEGERAGLFVQLPASRQPGNGLEPFVVREQSQEEQVLLDL
jgi:hypothetical protein